MCGDIYLVGVDIYLICVDIYLVYILNVFI